MTVGIKTKAKMSEPLLSEFGNDFDEDFQMSGNVNNDVEINSNVNEMDDADIDVEDADDEEEITAQKVLEFLETAWRNEIAAPEILPHQSDMLELMMGQLTHMEQNMKDIPRHDFRAIIHRMEIERIRYIIVSYLRCRLCKIETYTRHILNEELTRGVDDKRLSIEEIKFANEYYENQEQYFHQVALQHMPNMQRSDDEQRLVRPNLMNHVFVKANITVPAVIVGADDEEVDLTAGSQHIIPYQLIADLIKANQVQLI